MKISDEVQVQARALIADRLGLDFRDSRQADLERGLRQALGHASAVSPEEYLARLATLPDQSPEWSRLARALTVGETYFFRDQSCFDALEERVIPELIEARCAEGSRRLRLWSAGCATGEEPYSLAMLLDRLLPNRRGWTLTILATDINPEALEAAQRGQYREWSLRQTPPAVQDRYFRKVRTDVFEIGPAIREMVTFAPLNLAENCYPSILTNTNAMDLILCRNVIMYFTAKMQQAVADRLCRALLPDGWLVVSPVEASAALFPTLGPAHFPDTIMFRKNLRTPRIAQDGGWPRPVEVLPQQEAPSTGRTTRAEPGLSQTSMRRPPEVPPDPLLEASTLADRGRLQEAKRVCRTKLAQDRLNVEAHLLLAAICQERGETAEAKEALRHAVFLSPNSIMAHFLLGSLLFREGTRAKARRCLDTAITLLRPLSPVQIVPESGGLTAGHLLQTVQGYAVMLGQKRTQEEDRHRMGTGIKHPSGGA